MKSLLLSSLVMGAAAISLRHSAQSTLESSVYAPIHKDLSFAEHNPEAMKRMVSAMSIEEAMEKAGHLIPQEVRSILTQGSITNSQAPASGEYNGLKGVIDKINEMYLSTFKDLDITKIECMTTLSDLKAEQYQLQQDDKRMTGDLADDQASLIEWTATKNSAVKNIMLLKEAMAKNVESCNRETAAANDLLNLMKGDFNVSNSVVMNSDCAKALGSPLLPLRTTRAWLMRTKSVRGTSASRVPVPQLFLTYRHSSRAPSRTRRKLILQTRIHRPQCTLGALSI